VVGMCRGGWAAVRIASVEGRLWVWGWPGSVSNVGPGVALLAGGWTWFAGGIWGLGRVVVVCLLFVGGGVGVGGWFWVVGWGSVGWCGAEGGGILCGWRGLWRGCLRDGGGGGSGSGDGGLVQRV